MKQVPRPGTADDVRATPRKPVVAAQPGRVAAPSRPAGSGRQGGFAAWTPLLQALSHRRILHRPPAEDVSGTLDGQRFRLCLTFSAGGP